MAFDLEKAKAEGYTSAEIADYLGKESKFKVDEARSSGYDDDEIVSHLVGLQTDKEKPVNRAIDAIKSGVSFVKDAAVDAFDNRTLSEKGLLKPKAEDATTMSPAVNGVPFRADYVDKLKQQDRIAPQSIAAMAGTNNFGNRTDGTAKGNGFLGVLKRPDGGVSTELSIGVNIDGKEVEIPSLVPTLTPEEVNIMLTLPDGQQPPKSIIRKAADFARSRIAEGKSPFAQDDEVGKGAKARLAETIIKDRPFNQELNDGTNAAFEQEAPKPFDERMKQQREIEQLAKIKAFQDTQAQASETGNADNALKQATQAQPTDADRGQIAFEQDRRARGIIEPTNDVDRYWRDFQSGTVGSTGAALSFIGKRTNTQGLSELGDSMDNWSKDKAPAQQNFSDKLVNGIGSMASFYVPGIGVAKGAQALSIISPVLAKWTGAGTMAALEASAEADGVYKDLIQQGATDEEAMAKADVSFLSNMALLGVTNKVAFFNDIKMFDDATKQLILSNVAKKGAVGFASEGIAQEAPQQMISNYLTDKPLLEGVVESALIGGIVGGGAAVVGSVATGPTVDERKAEKIRTLPTENLERLKQTAAIAMPADVPVIEAEIQRRANTPTLQRAAEAYERMHAQQATESIQAAELLDEPNADQALLQEIEANNVSEPNVVTELATDTSGLVDNQPTGSAGDSVLLPDSTTNGGLDPNADSLAQGSELGDVVRDGDVSDNSLTQPENYINVEGAPIDKEWTSFNPNTGTLNIPRAEMPQIKAAHRGAMVNFLNARDISHEKQTVPASSLKPTQMEFSEEKVKKALGFKDENRSILVSSDNHVLDGHHQWLAKLKGDENIDVIRLNAPIKDLLGAVAEFPSAQVADGATAITSESVKTPEVKPVLAPVSPAKKSSKKSGTLLATLRDIGGISIGDKLDVTGEGKSFAPGGYNQVFKQASKQTLRGAIESGALDDFLPPAMRLSSINQGSDAFDSAEAYDYLGEKIRNGERVINYDVEQEIKANEFYQADASSVQSDIDELAFDLLEEQINEQLRTATNQERETNAEAKQFIPDSAESDAGSGTGTPAGNQSGIGRELQPKTIAAPSTQSAPSQEREGVRDLVTALVKRRAAANELGKSKQFDEALQSAKDFMAGKDVKPAKFLNASLIFNKDQLTKDAFTALQQLAKAPASEARKAVANVVDDYKAKITAATTEAELTALGTTIQKDKTLSDAQAIKLDDAIAEAQDSLHKVIEKQPKVNKKPVKTNFRDEIEKHFAVGNIIKSDYWKKFDLVDAFEWNDGRWEVTVHNVTKDENGNWIRGGVDRVHRTVPSKKDIIVEQIKNAPDNTTTETTKPTTNKADLLGDDTKGKQAIAAAEQLAFKYANKEAERQAEYDIEEALRDIGTTGNGADISELSNNPQYWDVENEELTDEGYAEYDRLNLEIAKERAGAKVFNSMDDLNDANQSIQAEAFFAYAEGLGIYAEKSYSSGGSRYVTVNVGDDRYKVRFADHFNTVRDTTMQPDFNVAEGGIDFFEAIDWLNEKITPASTSDFKDGSPITGMQERQAVRADKSGSLEELAQQGAGGDGFNISNNKKESKGDLLGQDTSKKQAVSDAERAKDVKRNSGKDNAEDFNLTGSDSEADKAAGAGARPLFSRSGGWNPEKYSRVMPRDLFNEAKTLAMSQKIVNDFNAGKLPEGFEIELENESLNVGLSEDGSLFLIGLNATFNGNSVQLTVPYNSGKTQKFPLEIADESIDAWSVSVFDSDGNISDDFKEYFGETASMPTEELKLNGKWEAAKKFMNQLGMVGLWEVDGVLTRDFVFDLKKPEDGFKLKQKGNVYNSSNLDATLNGEKFEFFMSLDDQKLRFKFNDISGEVLSDNREMSKEFEDVLKNNSPQFSRSLATKDAYQTRIDELFKDEKASFGAKSAIVLDKSDVLDMLGYGDKPVYLNESKVVQGKYNHKLTAAHWKKVPEWLENPAMVFDSDTVKGRLTFIAPETINGAPIRMIVEPDADSNGLKINLLINSYDAQIKAPYKRWIDDGLLRYYSKEKSPAILARSGLQLSSLAKARSSNARILVDSDLVKYRAKPALSRAKEFSGMLKADVQSVVDNLSSSWINAPQIVVVSDMADSAIPEEVRTENERQLSQGAEGQPEGFFYKDKVYVVANEMNTDADIARVLFHETLGHFGLHGTYGKELKKILNEIAVLRRPLVIAKAKQYGLDINDAKDRLIAAEEVLAEMAQANPQAGIVKRAIAAIRQWLRDNGFNLKLTDDDIIINYLLPARQFVQGGGKEQRSSDMVGAFSRTENTRSDSVNEIPSETNVQAIQRIGQDKFNRFKVLQDWLVDKDLQLSEAADVYLAETLMSGRIASRKEDFREGQVEPLIKKTQAAGFNMEQIGDFLKAQHAPEANKRARELQGQADATAFGVTDADAKTAMDEFKALPNFAELKKIANEWRAITEKTKQIKFQSGLLTDEMVKAWEDTYDVYVPVKGNDDVKINNGTGSGLDVKVRNKQRLGHGLRDEAIIENILRDHESAISLDEKNIVGKALIKFALEAKNDDIITIGKPEKRKVLVQGQSAYMVNYHGSDIATFDSQKDARQYVADAVLKGSDKAGFDIQKTTDPVRVMLQASPQLADNEVTVYVAGHAVRLQINDDVAAREYKNMGVEHLNTILSAGREVNNWLSKAYTGYSPDFIFTNPIRDAIQGAITLTGNLGGVTAAKIYANYPVAVKELVMHFRNKGSSKIVNEYRMAGGSTGGAYLSDLERIGNDIQSSFNEYQGVLATYKNTYDKAISEGKSKKAASTLASLKSGAAGFKKIPIVGHFMRLMENINSITENALRVATFKTLSENGFSKQKAAAQAKNLMNFNRKGEQSNAAGSLFLFFNPSVQGTKLIQEALFTSPHKRQAQALAGGMVLTAFTLAMMALNGDDEDKKKWNNTPDYIKDGNIVVDMFGTQFTITMPYGYRVFWTLGNVMADATQKGADFAKLGNRMASSMFANFSPIGNPMEGENGLFQVIPTTLKMALAPGVNEDSFGMSITPKKWNDATPDSQLMNRGTHGSLYDGVSEKLNELSGGSKYEAGMVDVSPETLKFWVKSLTGGAGQFAFDSINIINQGAQGVAPQDFKDVPVVRKFVREPGIRDARSAFWERKNEADLAAGEFAAAKQAHDRDAMMELRQENGALIRMSKMSDRMLKMANAKRKAVALIQLDKTIPLSQRIQMTKELENEELKVYDKYISIFDAKIKQ